MCQKSRGTNTRKHLHVLEYCRTVVTVFQLLKFWYIIDVGQCSMHQEVQIEFSGGSNTNTYQRQKVILKRCKFVCIAKHGKNEKKIMMNFIFELIFNYYYDEKCICGF